MRLTEIEKGKRYWKRTTVPDEITGKRRPVGNKIYVIDVYPSKGTVLASYNGAPAKIYTKYEFARWKTENPELTAS